MDGNSELQVLATLSPVNNLSKRVLHLADSRTNQISVAVTSRVDACSDGMSDVSYPIDIVWTEVGPNGQTIAGCCSALR